MFIYFIFGSIFGSFLGLVIDRFPEKSIIWPASHCFSCSRKLKFFELIPLISQLVYKNRCRTCNYKIPYRYFFIELFTGLIFLLASTEIINFAVFCNLLLGLTLTFYDIDSKSYPLSIWIFFNIPLFFLESHKPLVIFFLLLAILALIFDIQIGAGDFLILASMSFSLSYMEVIILVQLASILGICYYFYKKERELPLVPFLFTSYSLLLLTKILLP